jgi:N-sulfoglucosamine sulfohydrolase
MHTRLLLLFLTLSSFSFGQQRPNILWIVCEDISPYIGAYGNHELSTPNIDQLAREGVRFTNAFTTAGVCAPSRSSIITGMYPTSIGTQHMRTSGDPKYQPVPSYSAVIPDYVRCFPEYLRLAGYYCTNNQKTDYQFEAPVTVWDENSAAASFRNRPKDKPFFSVFNLFITHESNLFVQKGPLEADTNALTVPPIYPDTRVVRHDIGRLYTNIQAMDRQVGEIITLLKQDGLYDNTIIFFYSDHGGNLPWMKREILERGTHIPLIIRFPGKEMAGTVKDDLISAVDFAPTVLSLAGIRPPAYLQGRAFLGKYIYEFPRGYVFAARDRMDTEYDRVRMVRDKRYRYLRNFMPEKPYYQDIAFRLDIPMMKEILDLKDKGTLPAATMGWFATKPIEELYDVEKDPWELHNLATDPIYKSKLEELRGALQSWTDKVGDMSSVPEKDMIAKMWNGQSAAPVTATPVFMMKNQEVNIACSTPGASIGYRIERAGDPVPGRHLVKTWDYGLTMGMFKSGSTLPVQPVWNVYDGKPVRLEKGDTLVVNAMRIGYKASIASFAAKE